MQALTKYPSGGGDVLMGSVTTRDEALHLKLKFAHMRLGWGVGANDAELVLRSLPTLALRYAAQDRAARTLAEWLGAARRDRARAAPGAARLARLRALAGHLPRGGGPVLGRVRRALRERGGRCLRRCAAGCSASATRGPGPVSLVVPYHVQGMRSQPTPYAGVRGALLDRLRGRRGPARRPAAGLASRWPSAEVASGREPGLIGVPLRSGATSGSMRPCVSSGGPFPAPSRASSRCCACRAAPCPWRARSRPSPGRPCSAGSSAPA